MSCHTGWKTLSEQRNSGGIVIDALLLSMKTAAGALDRWPSKEAHIYHHNDADGLSSAAILSKALSRKGYGIQRCGLEKPYPEVLQRVFRTGGRLVVFADFAGRIASLINDLNRGRNLVLILDHHPALPVETRRLYHLNPTLFGLKGDRDISASTNCFLFAKALDQDNSDLAHLAVIGAVGDNFLDDGRLTGANRQAALEAQGCNTIEIQIGDGAESYHLTGAGHPRPVTEVVDLVETLGAAGYYQGGAELGVECLLNGFSDLGLRRYQSLGAMKKSAFSKMVRRLEGGALRHSSRIQWFHVGDEFSPMGVKMVGVFCHFIRQMDFIDPDKYIVGFQHLPEEVPGFGRIAFNADKISMRVPPLLANRIRTGEMPGLDTFFPRATNRLGGFSDGCHGLAAATTLSRGNETALIDEMERILGKTTVG